jgi:glycine/D-amino acid oxidase-like deaminating enzyme
MTTRVAVIGCGIVGAAIAYELSQVPGLQVTVCDRREPAQGATGAALGILMGAISQKTKGRAWQLRQTSLERYIAWIPDLEAATGKPLPVNRQGIVMLCFEGDDLERWQRLIDLRQAQGWHLEYWGRSHLQTRCPQIQSEHVIGAIYSPQDIQFEPAAMTLALVEAARQRGVKFRFGHAVTEFQSTLDGNQQTCHHLVVNGDLLPVDHMVIAAGLGSTALTESLATATTASEPLDIRPVLGQAIRMELPAPLGHPDFQPVITGHDRHIAPASQQQVWVGATVEFPPEEGDPVASSQELETVLQEAIAFCPALAQGRIVEQWSGLRPRPFNRPAPIIEPMAGYTNVVLATGHYRNGVLLAPATALQVRDLVTDSPGH